MKGGAKGTEALKRHIYQFIQYLAASVFIGLSVYGLIIFMGGEIHTRLPFWTSLLLGLGAIVCIVIVVIMGGILDRIMAREHE